MGSLSNALSNAAQSLLGNISGLINGQNPITQPQIAQLIGFNLPAAPLVSTRDYFLTQLQSWVSTPSLQSQWIAVIDRFPAKLSSQILRNLERTGGNRNAFDINVAKTIITSYPYQRVTGCIFCNSFETPEENYTIESVSVANNRGFLPGIISGNRPGYGDRPLTLGFMDVNTSFTDFVIRPWVMLASHYGYVTRKDPNFNIKCNITLLTYSKTFQDISMIPKKVFRFYNCVPIQVARQNYEYTEKGEVTSYTANFSYTNYTVENSLYLPLPQIIKTAQQNQPFFPNPTVFR